MPLAALLVLGGAACSASGPAAPALPSPTRVGLETFAASTRPHVDALAGPSLDAARLRVGTATGHVLVINVWASWCTQCRRESPLLARLSRTYAARGIRFVGVDERDTRQRARRFAVQAGARYPELFDPDGRLLALLPELPQTGIPSTLIVDGQGRAAARIVGAATPDTLRRAVIAAR